MNSMILLLHHESTRIAVTTEYTNAKCQFMSVATLYIGYLLDIIYY